MLIKLVSTPLYSSIINYIVSRESYSGENANVYTVQWTIGELVKANYLSEAGQLQLLSMSVPAALRGFTQAVLYGKNLLNKK